MDSRVDASGESVSTTTIAVDVTTFISAEEFALSRNAKRSELDPFARQSYTELLQSLLLYDDIVVMHPTMLHGATVDSFGERPWLLRYAMDADLVRPLDLKAEEVTACGTLDDALQRSLKREGDLLLRNFVTSAAKEIGARPSLLHQIAAWAAHQVDPQRLERNQHGVRITTRDGIEDDALGTWARAASVVLGDVLSPVGPDSVVPQVVSVLTRGLRYRCRAKAAGVTYQAHPTRRDFAVMCGLFQTGLGTDRAHELLDMIRGVSRGLAQELSYEEHLVQIVEFELPLLGGRLWRESEPGGHSESGWIRLVVDRIKAYREKCQPLREVVRSWVHAEQGNQLTAELRALASDLEGQLKGPEPGTEFAAMVRNVPSVGATVEGAPVMKHIHLAAGNTNQPTESDYVQFLYGEFIRAFGQSAKAGRTRSPKKRP
jgi:hypothetical protein